MTTQPEDTSVIPLMQEDEAPLPAETPDETPVPEWVKPFLPSELVIPQGVQVAFLRFPSRLTAAPGKGVPSLYAEVDPKDPSKEVLIERLSRVVVVWTITLSEERLGTKAARTSALTDELSKRMIRAVDGRIVDWTGNKGKEEGYVYTSDPIWQELGPKCRIVVRNLYNKFHSMNDDEATNFFLNCLVVKSSV